MNPVATAVIGTVLRPGTSRVTADELLIDDGGRVAARLGGQVASRRIPAGAVVLPGFVEPHAHLLAAAARRLSVDVGDARDIASLIDRVAAGALADRRSWWLRVVGYDEAFLDDRVQLSRSDLDRVAPERPVVVHHRNGAQVVCNSTAMRELGLLDGPPPPAVDTDDRGEATGRITRGHDLLAAVPRLPPTDLRQAVASVSSSMLRNGTTAITDATHTNDVAAVEHLAALRSSGVITQRLEAMLGASSLEAALEAGLSHGDVIDGTTLGHVKLIPEAAGAPAVNELVVHAHDSGWPVAVHVLDIEPLEAALAALRIAPGPEGIPARLEHVSLSTPEQVQAIADVGAAVVTNPSFLVHRMVKYQREFAPVELDWLYRMGSLVAAGVDVAASSDTPVVPARPLELVAAATGRGNPRTPAGASERVDVLTALASVTAASGRLTHHAVGLLAPGDPADYVVLSADPRIVPADEVESIDVLEVYVSGRRVV